MERGKLYRYRNSGYSLHFRGIDHQAVWIKVHFKINAIQREVFGSAGTKCLVLNETDKFQQLRRIVQRSSEIP